MEKSFVTSSEKRYSSNIFFYYFQQLADLQSTKSRQGPKIEYTFPMTVSNIFKLA